MSEAAKARALLLVDVQNDFCPGGALAVQDGDQVVPVINRLIPQFEIVIATQDWHPQDHISFASNHEGKAPLETVRIGELEQVLWTDHCVQGTAGATLHHDLHKEACSLIIRKGFRSGIDSYSAFFENDRVTRTGLHGYLQELGIGSLFIAGLATDYCVYFSALDALQLGYTTYVIKDACRGVDFPEGNVIKTLEDILAKGGALVSSQEIMK